MPSRLLTRALGRLPGLRRLPLFKLLAVAEIALLARKHVGRLDSAERHRLVQLVRKGRGRSASLDPSEREELVALVAKLEPRAFVGVAVDKLSPVPLPRRLVHGSRRSEEQVR